MKKIIATLTSFLIVAPLLVASSAVAATITLVVSQSNSQNWSFVENSNVGTHAIGEFVTGPGTPPLGSGSVRFFTDTDGTNSVEFRNNSFAGIRLDSLNALSYKTFVTSSDANNQAPHMFIEVDNSADPGGSTDVLEFLPELQVSLTALNTWQSWDALSGNWLSLHTGVGFGTISNYLRTFPNSRIANVTTPLGGVGFRSGFGLVSDVFDGNVDAFTIGVNGNDTTYDFENIPQVSSTPTNKDQCKKGGWQNFNNPVFENQGACVSFVQANRDKHHDEDEDEDGDRHEDENHDEHHNENYDGHHSEED